MFLVILACVFAIFLVFLAYKTASIYNLKQKYKHIPGPKVDGILGFYLGNLSQFSEALKKNKPTPELYCDWVKVYGPVFKYQVLDKIKIFVADPEGLREILINQNFPKHPEFYTLFGFPFGVRFLGRGLLTDFDDKRWKHRRDLFNPCFYKQVLTSFTNEFNSKSDVLIEKLMRVADGKTHVSMLSELNHATLDVISSVAFGMQTDSINDPNDKLNSLVFLSGNGFIKAFTDPLTKLKPTKWPYLRTYRNTVGELRDIGRKEIQTRLKVLQEGGHVPQDLLTILLKNCASSSDEQFELEDLIDDFVTFFVAGQETTANTLAFSIMELGRHPEILAKAREELDRVAGSNREINQTMIANLPYLGMVIKEVLRLWSTVPGMSRLSTQDIKIRDYDIPKGTWLTMSPFVSGRNEEYFENPLEFKPERFANTDNIHNYTYFPFSLGARNCIGQNFANIEARIMLAKFLQNFEFKLDPNQNFGAALTTTIAPAGGVRCVLLPRKN